jgi:hypothetical protein
MLDLSGPGSGLTQVHKKGFTALDGFGLLVEGFEHRPALTLITLITGAG